MLVHDRAAAATCFGISNQGLHTDLRKNAQVMPWQTSKLLEVSKFFKLATRTRASSSSSAAAAATMSNAVNVVEHVVFFKVKQDVPAEKKNDMVRELNALKKLDGVLHLKAGPALNLWPAHKSWSGGFTHVLHSRYTDKAALAAYAGHPAHVRVVDNFVKPIAEDLLAIDWEATVEDPLAESFEAKRIVACKLKDGVAEADKSALLEAISGKHPASAGTNFSPGRAKGFNFGYLAFFKSIGELEQLENPERLGAVESSSPAVESLIVLDYANDAENSAKI